MAWILTGSHPLTAAKPIKGKRKMWANPKRRKPTESSTVGPTSRIWSRNDISKSRGSVQVEKWIDETQRFAILLWQAEIIQQSENRRNSLFCSSVHRNMLWEARKLTGVLALVPPISDVLPPITTSKLSAWAETSGYARPVRLRKRRYYKSVEVG